MTAVRFALLLFVSSLALRADVVPGDLDQYVQASIKAFEVPGMAVGIVKDGKLVYARGFGVRELGKPEKVDERTLFGIASNTKAFTTAALAILVDEKKIEWDAPVQRYLPNFAMYDPYLSTQITVRDLVCHRTGLGLGAGDLLFWPDTNASREDVVNAVRFIKPASSLRSKYAYNNLMFVVAGQVIAAVAHMPYEDFVKQRIFAPLAMTESRITSIGLTGNVAQPHSSGWRGVGTLTRIEMTKDDTWAAAAGVKTNIVDISKWMIAQLAHGDLGDGKRLFSSKQSETMWSPQTIIPIAKSDVPVLAAAAPQFAAYGLGWSMKDYKGRKIVQHGGALAGMVTTVVLVPGENLGVVVFTNQEVTGAYNAVVQHVFDEAFGLPKTDWIAAYQQSRAAGQKKANDAEQKIAATRAKDSKPSLEAVRYTGEYQDAWYGKIVVTEDHDNMTLRFMRTPAMVADLHHWQYDTFVARFRDKTIPDAFVTFDLDYRGRIASVQMRPISTLADFSFDYQDLDFKPVAKEEEHALALPPAPLLAVPSRSQWAQAR